MKITKIHSDLIPCENFDLDKYLGALQNITNQFSYKNQQKNMKEEQFCIHSVNRNFILSYSLTCEYLNDMYILHMKWFVSIWKPKMSVHVKLAKLASIPPRCVKLAPTQPKWSRMEVCTWLRCDREIMTPWYAWVCKIR